MNSPFVFPEVRLVMASAGSGKTWALARRYIQLLLYTSSQNPHSFKHILAITFTNKAAGEMKARIVGLLKNIALGTLSPAQADDILGPLGMTAQEAKPLAEGLMNDLIRQYHFFQVQTIDSFMNALLAGCAFKINLSARFKIKRNTMDYLQLSLDKLIDQAHEQKPIKELFEVFISQYLFLENRSGWFPKKDLLGVLSTLFNHYNTYHRPYLTFGGDDADAGLYKRQFLKIAEELNELLPVSTDKRFKSSLVNFLRTHEQGFDIDEVSRYFARRNPPISNPSEVTSRLKDLWQKSAILLRAICLQEAYAVFNPYVNVFNHTMQCLDDIQTKEDVLFLQQLNKKTAELFDEGLVTVEELYYRLATRFRHYLLDEFQDTSKTQWHNLRMMVVEALSTGGTMFCVGDKKQAIYGFRGGHSHLFEEIEGELTSFNVRREILDTNYRSHARIVEFNNRLFDGNHLYAFFNALEQQEKLKDRDIVFTPEDRARMREVFGHGHQQVRSDLPHGAVRIEIISGRTKQQRHPLIRQKVLSMVKDIHTRFAYRDMAILTRNNTQVQLVTQWLVEEGIPAQSERTSDVKHHWLVRELIAFLQFLHSPVNNRAFAEFLLGELFPKVTALSPAQIQGFLFACRSKNRTQVYFYKCFKDAYPHLWDQYLEEFFSQAGIYPLYELMVSICGRFKCLELFPATQGFVMHFLELIKRKEEDGCDLESFLEYFDALENEERFIPMPAQDAVQVLTIHKAKGLEFPAVIVPFLEMPIKAGAGDRQGTQSFTWDIEEDGMRMLRLKESYTRFSEELRERFAREYKECLFSELNNVYVATTRAVFELHMLVPERVGNSINPAMMLIPADMFHGGDLHAPSAVSAKMEKRVFLPSVSYQQWLGKLQEDFLLTHPDLHTARLSGEILHFCLSQLKNLAATESAEVLPKAVAVAQARFMQGHDWEALEVRLTNLLAQPLWREFFYLPDNAQVFCEQEVVDRRGNTRRLDRLIVLTEEMKIVDFKTSRLDQEQHQVQIQEYVAMMKELHPHKKISGHLLYVDDVSA